MKKILVTRKLLKSNEQKISKLWEVKLNLNDGGKAYDWAIGDIVAITHSSIGFSAKNFRVNSITMIVVWHISYIYTLTRENIRRTFSHLSCVCTITYSCNW